MSASAGIPRSSSASGPAHPLTGLPAHPITTRITGRAGWWVVVLTVSDRIGVPIL